MYLLTQGQGVMNGDRCFVLWNSVAQWASLIHNWAVDRGLTNTVLTLFEIHGGDDTEGEPFHTMGKNQRHIFIFYLESL